MSTQPHRIIDVAGAAALPGLQQALAAAPALAVDVETNAMYAYRWRLCFVQIATEDEIIVVDTLAEGVAPQALAPAFSDPGKRKVFHDAQGDLRVLAREGLHVQGLFDTHRAATLLGVDRVGLGNLVESRFGVRLAKEHQTADFGQRPLPPELHAYVADDVRYLLPLAAELEREAKEKEIWEELELEFERIAWEAAQPEAPPRLKLPTTARTALGLAVAGVVDRLRHREASARDVPVGRVLANAAMGEIATRLPKNERELARIPGVKGSFVKVAGRELLAEIERLSLAGARGELPPPPAHEGRRDPERRDREERLKAFRNETAKARGVTPSVILPTPVLDRLASQPPADLDELAQVPWLGEKRQRLYGEALLALLEAP
ncbi:ribonuclease D [Vulgatibacter sp.]|uniref:ribonuclease D n=1 Tax=Vulgatibacter sp. TaxID=1971226 RepID=UPI003563D4FC